MDSLRSQHVTGTDTQQPRELFLNAAHDGPGGLTNFGWSSHAWGPITLQPSVFATGVNGIPITPRAHLRHNCTELGGEPGGATTPLRRHSAPNLHNHERREETGGPPASNIPPTGNGVLFDGVVPPKAEGRSLMLPKSGRFFCEQCPELPSFTGKNALKKHRRQAHVSTVPRCPICSARVPKQPLARHLEKIHGVNQTVVEAGSLPVSTPTHTNGTAELLDRPQRADEVTVSHTNETMSTMSGRIYCREYDCGRGFSSKAHLESHTRFFHSKQSKRDVEVQAVSSSPKDVAKRFTEHPIEPTFIPLQVIGEPVIRDSYGPRSQVGTHAPDFGGGYQGINSVASNAGEQSKIPIESSPSIQGGVNTQQKRASPATDILSLHCRMCEAPPTVTTQPTVTTCGHLFCSACITQHVASTSRCPVCNSSLLLYCLFKLDLPLRS